MAYSWRRLRINRFFGIDLKTNISDVPDGVSLDANNVYQNAKGVISKRKGFETMFLTDAGPTTPIDEIGSAELSGTKYYFYFADGKFHYANLPNSALTTLTPSPAISTTEMVHWCVQDDKIFFVDGTNNLRYFDGTQIKVSKIYARPTVAPTTASGGTGFDYTYTVDNGLGESPACDAPLLNKGSAATIRVTGNFGPDTLVSGDVVRIYSKGTTVAAASFLVAEYTWSSTDVTTTYADITTVAIADGQLQLYTELGLAINRSAPAGLQGITVHYNRLVGWKNDTVYNSKSSNPHSWPDENAPNEAFVYGFDIGNGEKIQACRSFRESLFVLKKTKIAIFVGVGPDDSGNNAYAFRRLETNGIGCVAPKSAVVVGDDGKSFLVWLSDQGFYASNGDVPLRIGQEIEDEIQTLADTSKASCVAIHHKREGFYTAVLGPSSNRSAYTWDVREDKGAGNRTLKVGWFRLNFGRVKCLWWDKSTFIAGTYDGVAIQERNAKVSGDYRDPRYEYIDPSAINAGADTITVGKVYTTGDEIQIRTSGTAPGGLSTNLSYYVIKVSDTVIKLALTAFEASTGTAIDITTQGTGVHSLQSFKAISAFYTTNWLNFGTPSHVKKVAKPSMLINALAPSVTVSIETAYDWQPVYGDLFTLQTGSSHLWGQSFWGVFVWGEGATTVPKNIPISRRKFRSIRFRFTNNNLKQDFNVQGLEIQYDILRNRGNFASE